MNTLRVLLVDDCEGLRWPLARFLIAQEDIDVVGEAGDGNEPIEQAERLRPDLILMDVHMSNRNGLEAAREIKSQADVETKYCRFDRRITFCADGNIICGIALNRGNLLECRDMNKPFDIPSLKFRTESRDKEAGEPRPQYSVVIFECHGGGFGKPERETVRVNRGPNLTDGIHK